LPTIYALSSETINKIAAGEVIESPSSCLKELIENAIDAHASDIVIEVEEGGKKLVLVSDSGLGMSHEDAHLCFKRHATSKIQSADDLFSIHTMGFRGEALAAIASISKVSLTTCPKNSIHATHIQMEGGQLIQEKPASRDFGTTIEVRDLFFNVPVRKQFQKTLNACISEVQKTVELLALANPDISFTLISDGRLALNTPSAKSPCFLTKLKSRLLDVQDASYLQESLEIDISKESFQLIGYLKDPSLSRPNRTGECLFINKRAVRCPDISNALKEGLSSSLSEGRYPQFCLHLFLPPEEIDVNIHPQKKEVKLKNPKNLKRALSELLAQTLHKKSQEKGLLLTSASEKSTFTNLDPLSFSELSPQSYGLTNKEDRPPLFQESLMTEQVSPLITSYFFIGNYLFFELESHPNKPGSATVLCNLKAAIRAITYAELLESEPPIQKLLFPITWELSLSQVSLARAFTSFFASLGFHMRAAGPRSFFIDSIPQSMNESLALESVSLILEEISSCGLGQNDKKIQNEKLRRSTARALTRSAAKMIPLSQEEKKAFAQALIEKPLPALCPEGEALFIAVTEEDIEKIIKPEKAFSFSL